MHMIEPTPQREHCHGDNLCDVDALAWRATSNTKKCNMWNLNVMSLKTYQCTRREITTPK